LGAGKGYFGGWEKESDKEKKEGMKKKERNDEMERVVGRTIRTFPEKRIIILGRKEEV